MMKTHRAAIIARKSQDDSDKATPSTAVQIDRTRDFVKRMGWVVVEDWVREDTGVSGADFSEERVGFNAIFDAATKVKPRPFDVIVMRDQDRLGRDVRVPYLIQQLEDAGVQL